MNLDDTIHQPRCNGSASVEMVDNKNEKKLLSPQQVVFRKPADYKL